LLTVGRQQNDGAVLAARTSADLLLNRAAMQANPPRPRAPSRGAGEGEPKVTMSPAACQVVPDVADARLLVDLARFAQALIAAQEQTYGALRQRARRRRGHASAGAARCRGATSAGSPSRERGNGRSPGRLSTGRPRRG
jgi:hypothetical protein